MLLLSPLALKAQNNYPNGLSTDSVDPRADAAYIRDVRRRLEQVRTQEKRPTVALVLSGGGAKGAAEVGAIKYIEELGIPIDFVCGTSMGGLVGGMYALGYKADDLAELFRQQDWSVMLTDRVPAEFIPYSTKVDRATYLLTLPFWRPSPKDPDRPGKMREALRSQGQEELQEVFERPSRGASLIPSGYAYGFNVLNLLTSLSVGYQDSISFSKLPIPYACVAADMVTSNAKYWGEGSVITAMRSTMSIPGLFDPVRTGSMVLVDGGVRNNFPTDVAKAVGADLLIGVELSDLQPDYEDVDNLGSMLGRFIAMLGRDSFNKNVGKSDVFIKPEISEFNMLSFNKEAVDTLLARGYAAAAAQRAGLLAIREQTGRASAAPTPRATDIARTPVAISGIEYEGVDEQDARRLTRLTGLDPAAPLDRATIDAAMCRLQATGAFESVSYSLYGTGEPYKLVFHCKPAPVHSFALGLRADSEEGAALLFRTRLWANRLAGSKLSLTARLGQNMKGALHYSLDFGDLPTLNLDLSMSRYRGNLGSRGEKLKYDVAYWAYREDFYISGVDWTRLDFRAGIAHKGYSLMPQTVFARDLENVGMSLKSSYIGTYLQGNYYTLDAPYFPQRGVSLNLRADYDFVRVGRSDFSPILSCDFDFRAAVPVGRKLTFLPDVRLRSISHFGEKMVDGLIHTNFAGGVLAARYTEDQLPFFGVNHVLTVDDYVADVTLEMRYNPVGKLYFSALAGAIVTDNEIGGLITHPLPDIFALGAQAAYDTIVGPVKFNVHWSNTQGWGAYLGVGFDF